MKELKIDDISHFTLPRHSRPQRFACAIVASCVNTSFTLTGAPYVCPRHYTHLRGGVLLHIFLRALHRNVGDLLQVRPHAHCSRLSRPWAINLTFYFRTRAEFFIRDLRKSCSSYTPFYEILFARANARAYLKTEENNRKLYSQRFTDGRWKSDNVPRVVKIEFSGDCASETLIK